jgi:hypothetical protein
VSEQHLNTDSWPDELAEAWTDWIQHRREMKKPLTKTAMSRLQRRLERWGHARALAALEWSMENGWLGVYEPPAGYGDSGSPVSGGRHPGGFRLAEYLERRRDDSTGRSEGGVTRG